jgi:hypothetical protein
MELTEKIDEVLAEVLACICKNPSIFVSETDIHTLVAEALMSKITELSSKRLYPTKASIGKNQYGEASKKTYKTMRVHKEYGHGLSQIGAEDEVKPGSRSDIVIFNEDQIATIDDPINLKSGNAWIIPDYILEFGTEKCAASKDVFKKHFENDLKKTARSEKKGYVIHIHRNYCRSTGKSWEANKKKYEDYTKEIIESIKQVNSKVKVVIVLVELGSDVGRSIKKEGKVKIYYDGKFNGTAENKVKEKIKLLLLGKQ